jgi:hypothetical protein
LADDTVFITDDGDDDNVDVDFELPEEFNVAIPQHQPQQHTQTAYTSPSKNERCPICYEDIEGECWVCEQCHQEFCRECCEQWFGSALEYALPADETGPVYMLQAEQHNTTCPYCRYEQRRLS